MKVPCGEGLASHASPESCGGDREVVAEALTGEDAGRVSSSEILIQSGTPTQWCHAEGHTAAALNAWQRRVPRSRQTPSTCRSTTRGSREAPRPTHRCVTVGPRRESLRKE
jgi:hypothetical protein